jgi:hypothetical protein
MTDAKPNPHALWSALRFYIQHACAIIGLPSDIAQRTWIARWEYRRFADLLRPLEALLRRLVFLDAVKLPPEPPRIETKRRPRRLMRAQTGAAFDPARSETWRVRFNLGATSLRPAQRGKTETPVCPSLSKTSSAPLINVISSAPLALRLEALIRGFNDPAPLARRLARRLRRHPHVARDFSAPLAKRDAPRPCYHSVAEAGDLCAAAPLPFRDSS